MKTGKTLSELAAELDRQNNNKRDLVAPSPLITVTSNGTSKMSLGSDTFGVNDSAHEQIAARLNIPKKYYDRMRLESPALLDQNINHWLKNNSEKYLVRTLDGNVRALLSERYRPLDNYDLAEVALPELQKAGCNVVSCEVTERKLYIKCTTEKLTYDLKVGDPVQAGIVISNSEIGQGALTIEPLLLRLVCKNGMIVQDSKMRRNHIGRNSEGFDNVQQYFKDATRLADDKAFWLKVRDTIAGSFSQIGFETHIEKFRLSQGDKIDADPMRVIEIVQKHFEMTDTERTGVLKHLLSGNDLTRFGLANAVTRTAQDLESYDRATEFERIGGNIIELPRTDWNIIANG